MLRETNFKDLGWKKNVLRLILSWIVWQAANFMIGYLIGTIVAVVELTRGVTPTPIEAGSIGATMLNIVSVIGGAYLAWKFAWNNKRWSKNPENNPDILEDVTDGKSSD